MMWNNRIVRHEKDDTVWYSVHEVFYSEDGGIYGYTEDPTTILGETAEEVKSQLEMIMKDIEKHEVLDASTVKFEDWYNDSEYEVADCDHIKMPSKEQVEQKTLGKLPSGIYEGGHY